MIILDTDVFSLMELPDSNESRALQARIAQEDPSQIVATTVITYEEQSRGRLGAVARARSAHQFESAYRHLRQHVLNYRRITILEFDSDAIAIYFGDLLPLRLGIGTMDLRIGAIALARSAVLLSRNLRDFRKIPGLRVEDWTRP